MKMIKNKRTINYIIIVLTVSLYVFSYFLKLGYNANIVNFEIEYGVSHSEAGLVTTFFFITYGTGQIVNGIFVKKYNLKFVIPSVLILSAILNGIVLLIPIGQFNIIKYLWLLNGALLSVLWPSIIRFVAENLEEKYKNTSIVLFGMTTPIGTSLCYALCSLFTKTGNYKIIFYVAIGLGIIFAILWLFLYKVMKSNIEMVSEEKSSEEKKETTKNSKSFILFIIIICCFCAISDFAKDGVQTWFPSIMQEKYDFESSSSIILTLPLTIGPMVSAILAVQMNKKIKNHANLCTFFIILSAIFLALEVFINQSSWIISAILVTLCVVVLHSIISVCTTLLPVRLGAHKNAGFYAGLFNGCCYAGSAISTYLLGFFADQKGWNMTLCLLVYVLFGMSLFGIGNAIFHAIMKKSRAKVQ